MYQVSYPLGIEAGKDIHRSPMDQEAIAEVVNTIYTGRGGATGSPASISAEQLMYSVAGEKLVKHLLGRYQWKDAYIATKV